MTYQRYDKDARRGVGVSVNSELCDFLLSFLDSGGPADVDHMTRAARAARPVILLHAGSEKKFKHWLAAARETLQRQGRIVHCKPDGSPAREGEKSECWKLP